MEHGCEDFCSFTHKPIGEARHWWWAHIIPKVFRSGGVELRVLCRKYEFLHSNFCKPCLHVAFAYWNRFELLSSNEGKCKIYIIQRPFIQLCVSNVVEKGLWKNYIWVWWSGVLKLWDVLCMCNTWRLNRFTSSSYSTHTHKKNLWLRSYSRSAGQPWHFIPVFLLDHISETLSMLSGFFLITASSLPCHNHYSKNQQLSSLYDVL